MTLVIDIKNIIVEMKMKKIINALLIIDIGIVIFSLLSGNRIWFINSQIGFISSSLVILASIISYQNMVKKRVETLLMQDDNRDVIDKIEDPYGVYNQDAMDNNKTPQEILKEEKENLKKSNRSIWQIIKDTRPALSIYRLIAYALLIVGFFYLNKTAQLEIVSYLFSLIIPPATTVIILMRGK